MCWQDPNTSGCSNEELSALHTRKDELPMRRWPSDSPLLIAAECQRTLVRKQEEKGFWVDGIDV
jgi:hypothetical protein